MHRCVAAQVRLLVIYYLCTPSLSDADAAEYTAALAGLGVDVSVMTYLQHLRKMKQLSSRAFAMGGAAGGRGGAGGGLSLTDILSKVPAACRGPCASRGVQPHSGPGDANRRRRDAARRLETRVGLAVARAREGRPGQGSRLGK